MAVEAPDQATMRSSWSTTTRPAPAASSGLSWLLEWPSSGTSENSWEEAAKNAVDMAGKSLQELGLPYAADPAVTRHIGHFLRKLSDDVGRAVDRVHPEALAALTAYRLGASRKMKTNSLKTGFIKAEIGY